MAGVRMTLALVLALAAAGGVASSFAFTAAPAPMYRRLSRPCSSARVASLRVPRRHATGAAGLRAVSAEAAAGLEKTAALFQLDLAQASAGNEDFVAALEALVAKDSAGAKAALQRAEAAWKEGGKLKRSSAVATSPYGAALANATALAKGGAVTAAAAVQAQRDLAHHLIQRAETSFATTSTHRGGVPTGAAVPPLPEREGFIAQAAQYLLEAEYFYRTTGLLQEPEERGLLRTVRANVKFYFFKHRAELKTEHDAGWWRGRRAERAAARARVEEEAAALRDECKPRSTDMLSFAKEAGDQAFMRAEELVQDGKWKAAREALKETEHYWRVTGMLGFPGRPFEMAIEQLLDQCDAAQGLRSPRVGESGEPNRVVAEAAAEQSPYALRKRPWDI